MSPWRLVTTRRGGQPVDYGKKPRGAHDADGTFPGSNIMPRAIPSDAADTLGLVAMPFRTFN